MKLGFSNDIEVTESIFEVNTYGAQNRVYQEIPGSKHQNIQNLFIRFFSKFYMMIDIFVMIDIFLYKVDMFHFSYVIVTLYLFSCQT